MNLPQHIRQYYFDNFVDLLQDKQFHFADRLTSWNDDTNAKHQLDLLRSYMIPNEQSCVPLLRNLVETPPQAKINAVTSRLQYLEKYPQLRGLMLGLFRVRHLLHDYDIDCRSDFLTLYPYELLDTLATQLLDDPEALKFLSTYAVNYLYLLEHILYRRNTSAINPTLFYELSARYDENIPEHVQLLIYLYTHCIIGETNFYKQGILSERKETYNAMIAHLEQVISDQYDNINLDNKLEFLVCCRILRYNTGLFERIYRECDRSISSEGYFLVDRHNNFKQSDKKSFADSEHRNVLFIMSSSPYHKT